MSRSYNNQKRYPITCPYCQARPGQPCTTSTVIEKSWDGFTMVARRVAQKPHIARRRAAET